MQLAIDLGEADTNALPDLCSVKVCSSEWQMRFGDTGTRHVAIHAEHAVKLWSAQERYDAAEQREVRGGWRGSGGPARIWQGSCSREQGSLQVPLHQHM